MFKLIVVCAFIAAAAAEPGALLYQAPISQYSTYVQPAATTFLKADTGVLHPTQYTFGYPHIAHYIKKRSAAALDLPTTYYNNWAQAYNPYVIPNIASASYIAPTTYIAPATTNVHFIKKRSAPLLPTTYLAPSTYTAAASPIFTTSFSAASPLITSPLIPATNLYSSAYPYLIKK